MVMMVRTLSTWDQVGETLSMGVQDAIRSEPTMEVTLFGLALVKKPQIRKCSFTVLELMLQTTRSSWTSGCPEQRLTTWFVQE